MNPQRWQQVREVLDQAIALVGPERAALLDAACTNDPDLRREVDSLLRAHDEADGFLETPAANITPALADPPVTPARIGGSIGPYRILEAIGHGGMGEVFRAVRADGQYDKQVAIKLVRAGWNSESVLARFRHERQILARLEHPNIARLIDGGVTEDGVPYVVMEFVDGVPINEFCTRRALAVSERLRLFLRVCGAVQYAHQNLVVHRDLKPGNILVTREGDPKLLDFGIAGIIDSGATTGPTGHTFGAFRALTPGYASPEQIRGEAITTASDVYSLGVVLYELLTGCTPYRPAGEGPDALARAVCEDDPVAPSTAVRRLARDASSRKLSKLLRGDLDNILLMALRKEPDRRYPSVQQFSADVQRHLDNRTVSARPYSWRYSASRFIARNRAVSLVSALLVAVLVAGMLATQREARIAAAERDRAQRHFDSVRQLANSFMFDVHDEIAKLPGSNKARELLVNKALTYLDLLAKEAGGDPALRLELAEAYLRVGSVQGRIGYNNLGDHAAALKSFQQAIALLEGALGRDPASRPESIQLSRAYNLAAANLDALGRPTDAFDLISRNVDLMQRRVQRAPDAIEARARLGHALYERSQFRSNHGDPNGAVADAHRAVDIYEGIVAQDPDFKHRNDLVFAYSRLGEIQVERADAASRADGIESLRKALATMRALAGDRQDDVAVQRHLAVTAAQLGDSLVSVGRPREGLPYEEESLPIFRALYDADKSNRLARLDVAVSEENIGNLWVSLGDPGKGLEHCSTAVDLLGAAPNPPESDLEISAAFVEAQTDLSQAYAAAAEAAGAASKRRAEFLREARVSAAASLHTAKAIIAGNPAIAANYAAFLAKDQALLKRADRALGSTER